MITLVLSCVRLLRPGAAAAIAFAVLSATPMPAAHASDALCGGLTWPRPMPAVVGLTVDPLSDAPQPLTCLDNVKLVGPDGRVLSGTASGSLLRIAGVSPDPGTPVSAHDPVTVNLAAADGNSAPAYQPCDWVSTADAATFLGVAPIAASPKGVEQGSTDIRCDYSFNDSPDGSPNRHSVSSELRLTANHVVDAAAEYAAGTTGDSVALDGVGAKALCTPSSTSAAGKPVHRLQVLLPGDRLYLATGWGGESCDTLRQFAHAAIPQAMRA